MKKLLSIFVLFLVFSLPASAQDEKTAKEKEFSIKEKATQNVESFAAVMDLTNPMAEALNQIFYKKYKLLSKENITETEKMEVSNSVDEKLKAILNEELIKKLESKGIYKNLIN